MNLGEFRRSLIGIGMLLLTGCAVGPDFHHPTPPLLKGYTAKPMSKSTVSAHTMAGQKQHFQVAKAIPIKWWTVFHSTTLNKLIKESLCGNPDITAAGAALKMAHENTLSQKAGLIPWVTANYSPMRQLTAGTLSSNVASNAYLYTINTTNLSISYAPDVFGGTRRQIESAAAQEEAAFFQREAVYLTLTSNIVLAAIQEAALREQIKVTKRNISLAEELLNMMQKQRSLGSATADSVAAQAALLAQTKAVLPPLELQLAQQRHLITSLRGRFPSEEAPIQFNLSDFTLPRDLPVSLPAQLVAQRPDVRAAEAQMHAASAAIGVAIANRLPNINLNASGGYMPIDYEFASIPIGFPLLPTGTPLFWLIAGNLAGTIFDAGSLLHQQGKATAAYDVAVAQYKRVVLNAFEQVADALKAIQFDAESLKIANEQEQTARKSFLIAKRRWELGSNGYAEVLDAEQVYQQALANLAQTQANRFADTAALFQALGGGRLPIPS